MDKIYYHVHKLSGNSEANSPNYEPWNEGQKITVGEKENPFSESLNFSKIENYPVKDFLNAIHSKDLDDISKIRKLAYGFLTRSLNLAHELALELVRREEFPNAPSRFKCLWLCESFESAKRWAKILTANEDEPPQIVEVKAIGTVLKCDASLLTYRSEKLSDILDNARLYWQGAQGELVEENEILFVGDIVVQKVLPKE